MTSRKRPLSPHLQIYKLPLLAILSISHRLSGVALAAGTLLLACWLGSVAAGPQAFDTIQGFVGSPLGYVLLFGWSVALFYHLSNGIRHLVWDAGFGFSLPQAYRSGRIVLVATGLLTALAWIVGLAV